LKRGGTGRDYHGMHAMRVVVCLSAVASACASEPLIEVAYYVPPEQDPDDPCPKDGCGGNSPVVDGVYFWSLPILNVPSETTPDGVQVTGIQRNGIPMRFKVEDGDYLLGVHPVTGAVLAQGSTLPGTQIELLVKGVPYEIVIEAAAPSASFWVGAELPIWRYRFRYRPLSGPDSRRYRALCSEGDADPTALDAFVFVGDLYDPDTKDITVGPAAAGWMNIACADSALYKLHATAHTEAGQKTGVATTVVQRKAMLNAWTSNVCGTGEAFTRQGEPITLRESQGVFNKAPYNATPRSREAIWNENGAVCLNTHRLHEDDPDIYVKIAAGCPGGVLPPPCDDQMLSSWQLLGHVLTGNL
jgi:hypothetical protein